MAPGDIIVIMASGPSLTDGQVERVREAWLGDDCWAIAINTTYRRALWADVLYACDGKWWRKHSGAPDFKGLKVTQDVGENGRAGDQLAMAQEYGLKMLRSDHNARGQLIEKGLSRDPERIRTGGNSGYQAINLAVHLGAKRILLLGYDMKKGPNGETHWHGNHPDGLMQSQPFADWIKHFATLPPDLAALGVEVINVTPGSALGCFPRATLEEAL